MTERQGWARDSMDRDSASLSHREQRVTSAECQPADWPVSASVLETGLQGTLGGNNA